MRSIRNAYKGLYRKGLPFDDARAEIETDAAAGKDELAAFVRFFAAASRGIIR